MNNTKIFEGQSGSELFGMAFKYIISHCMQELTYNTYTSHSSRKAQKDRSVAFFMKYLARGEENWLSVLWSDEATFANTAHREIKKTSVKRGGVLKRGSTYAFSFHCTMGVIGWVLFHFLLCQPGVMTGGCHMLSMYIISPKKTSPFFIVSMWTQEVGIAYLSTHIFSADCEWCRSCDLQSNSCV